MASIEDPHPAPIPLSDFLKRTHLLANTVAIQQSLQKIVVEPWVIQDFRPLAESLEWALAHIYWRGMGVDAFAQSEVPFLINNDGQVSEAAAVTFFAHCRAHTDLPPVLTVLELGAGTGLFARFFLDVFADLCRQEEVDFYDRLLYYVTDASRRMVEHWQERDVFTAHAEHCVLAVADATHLPKLERLTGGTLGVTAVQAIFCNYILDVLPTAVLRQGSTGPEQLVVRTCLLDDLAVVGQYTRLNLHDIRHLVHNEDPKAWRQLLPLLPVLELETKFVPLLASTLPFLEEALAWGEGIERVLLNYGAVTALDACLALLHSDGFLVLNDYGPVRREDVATHTALQHFGGSVAHGLNFPLLEDYGNHRGIHLVTPPDDDEKPIHARLLMKRHLAVTRSTFENQFSLAAAAYRQKPRDEARRFIVAGRRSEALEAYKNALAIDARNWCLIGEAAEFVALQLKDFSAGLELARAALERNPWYSAWLWNILGDCLFCLERYTDAHEAYLQAERIDPKDPRTCLNLAYTLTHQGEFALALQAIARGLAADVGGQYREQLVEKQQHILLAVTRRWLSEQERSKYLDVNSSTF